MEEINLTCPKDCKVVISGEKAYAVESMINHVRGTHQEEITEVDLFPKAEPKVEVKAEPKKASKKPSRLSWKPSKKK